jgi:REP element-mobilizing transposase RayT
MARQLRIEFPGAFYHVIQRGIERKNIFASDKDKDRFLSYLNAAHLSYGAGFHSYVLMDNHYHLIVETPSAPLSKIMHYIDTAYVAYFNTKYKRTGPLYQGRFKAPLVEQDGYLHYVSCYIHLNPVRAGIVRSPEEYTYSSYNAFVSNIEAPHWLNTSYILSMFSEKASEAKNLYKQFVIGNIGKEKEILDQNTKNGFLIGSKDFFTSIKEKFINPRKAEPEFPVLRQFKARKDISMEQIKAIVERRINNDKKLRRSLSIYLSRKYTQKTLNEIVDFYGGIQYSAVSQVWRRIEMRRENDKGMAKLLLELETEIVECQV